MNANELADLLDKHTGGAGNIYQPAAPRTATNHSATSGELQ